MTNEDFIIGIMEDILELFSFDAEVTVMITAKGDNDEMLLYSTCETPGELLGKLEKVVDDDVRVIPDKDLEH